MTFSPAFFEVRDQVRNWGRWGNDDRIGTLNLIIDDAVAHAASLIKTGRRVSCALDLRNDGLQFGQVQGRINPELTMTMINSPFGDDKNSHDKNSHDKNSHDKNSDDKISDDENDDARSLIPHFSDDIVTMALQTATHWDGLSHVSYDNTLYNGVPASSINSVGASVLGIENIRHLTGRGVLLDLCTSKGVTQLPSDYEITPKDLDEAAQRCGVTMRTGDIVLLRTGRMQLLDAGAEEYLLGPNKDATCPGPGLDAVCWFHRHDVAAVATDTYIFEAFPGTNPDDTLAVHCLHLVDMGLTQGQNWNLETLAAVCAEENRYEFFLEANPEPFVGGCGSPVNPVAVF